MISSKANPQVKRWHRLASDARARRDESATLLEGAHLLRACLSAGRKPRHILVLDSPAPGAEVAQLVRDARLEPVVLAEHVVRAISDNDSPPAIMAEIDIESAVPDPAQWQQCVLLDGVQDAGNVGTILRSAAAFGVADAVLGPGCADPWSPKVLRAGQGAHFALRIARSDDLGALLDAFEGSVLAAVAREGQAIDACDLGGRNAWVFGSEGRGIAPALLARIRRHVHIPMTRGAESLNVAAAAAICFYESARQRDEGARLRAGKSR